MDQALHPSSQQEPPSETDMAGFSRVAVTPPPLARSVMMFVNKKAGSAGGSGVAQATQHELQQRGLTVHWIDQFNSIRPLAEALRNEGRLRAAVAVGGDGTVGALLNATPAGTPLAVVPAGTENLLSKYLKTGKEPAEVASLIEKGVAISLDAGVANGRLFAMMFSAGFDAEVVRRVHDRRTGNITHLAYAWPILNAVRSYRFPTVQAQWRDAAGVERTAQGRWVFGVNLPRYAQGLPIVPQAVGADGLLDLCLFERGHTMAGLWYLWNVVRRRHHKLASVLMETCTTCRMVSTTEEELVPYQLDGDPGGYLPVDVGIAPGRLRLLVRQRVATRLGFSIIANSSPAN